MGEKVWEGFLSVQNLTDLYFSYIVVVLDTISVILDHGKWDLIVLFSTHDNQKHIWTLFTFLYF